LGGSSSGGISSPDPAPLGSALGGACLHSGALAIDRTDSPTPALFSMRSASRPVVASHSRIALPPSSYASVVGAGQGGATRLVSVSRCSRAPVLALATASDGAVSFAHGSTAVANATCAPSGDTATVSRAAWPASGTAIVVAPIASWGARAGSPVH